jgi:hypothetical protein
LNHFLLFKIFVFLFFRITRISEPNADIYKDPALASYRDLRRQALSKYSDVEKKQLTSRKREDIINRLNEIKEHFGREPMDVQMKRWTSTYRIDAIHDMFEIEGEILR